MPTITDTAVCLRRWDFSETSQTVRLFTREHGIIRGLAKGAKRPRGDFSGGLDVLTRGEVVAIIKPGRDLATITEWHLTDTFRVVRQRLDANRAALYIVDLIHHLVIDHDPHPALFDALVATIDALGAGASIGPALLKLQWRVLEETGYRPELNRDAETGAPLPDDAHTLIFNARSGGVRGSRSSGNDPVEDGFFGGGWRVRISTIALLRDIAADRPIAQHDETAIGRANRLLAVYCREIHGSEIPTLSWAFPDLRGLGEQSS